MTSKQATTEKENETKQTTMVEKEKGVESHYTSEYCDGQIYVQSTRVQIVVTNRGVTVWPGRGHVEDVWCPNPKMFQTKMNLK